MDRLLSLTTLQANSVLDNNTSTISELGYETARDDSISSLYYSINDNTLADIHIASPPGHSQAMTIPDTIIQTNTESSIPESIGTDSSMHTLILEQNGFNEPSYLPVIRSNSDVSLTETVVDCPQLNQVRFQENVIHRRKGITGRSKIPRRSEVTQQREVQSRSEVPRQREVQRRSEALRQTQISRRTEMLRRTEMTRQIEMHRRTEMPRRTEMTRRTEIPRLTILSSRRTLIDANIKARAESNRNNDHICDVCKMSFTLRSTLTVHKIAPRTSCKYCDRTFKKVFALSIHLKENCEKIPSIERRKILTKEFKNASSRV